MNLEDLRSFLVLANKAGYAAEDTTKWVRNEDGSLTILYANRDLEYHDNFFGGDPFGGRLCVSQNAKPKWIMVYYGWVHPDFEANQVFQFLRSALKQMPENNPLRGPSFFQQGDFEYVNQCTGNLNQFSGRETIKKAGNQIYENTYLGGWVDSRSAL